MWDSSKQYPPVPEQASEAAERRRRLHTQTICTMLCAKSWREEAILSGIENILQRRFGTNAAKSDTAGDTTRAGKRLSEAWFPS